MPRPYERAERRASGGMPRLALGGYLSWALRPGSSAAGLGAAVSVGASEAKPVLSGNNRSCWSVPSSSRRWRRFSRRWLRRGAVAWHSYPATRGSARRRWSSGSAVKPWGPEARCGAPSASPTESKPSPRPRGSESSESRRALEPVEEAAVDSSAELERGRRLYEARAWLDAYDSLSEV